MPSINLPVNLSTEQVTNMHSAISSMPGVTNVDISMNAIHIQFSYVTAAYNILKAGMLLQELLTLNNNQNVISYQSANEGGTEQSF